MQTLNHDVHFLFIYFFICSVCKCNLEENPNLYATCDITEKLIHTVSSGKDVKAVKSSLSDLEVHLHEMDFGILCRWG